MPQPAPGVRVDHYTLVRRLGAGGMGEVWLADEGITHRPVALKMMGGEEQISADARERFAHEIKLLASLDHPNIALYAGHGWWHGRPYFVLQYVDGPSAEQLLRNHGRLPEAVVLSIGIQAAAGLEHANAKVQAIHRDLKPGNLLLDCGGRDVVDEKTVVKLIDFGLSLGRHRGEFEHVFGPTKGQISHFDEQKVVVGTPLYLAPEQVAKGDQIDFRADIYGLAGTMFHLIAGRPPYLADNVDDLMRAHVKSAVPDPSQLVNGLHPLTVQLLMRSMAKHPEARFASWEAWIRAARSAFIACTGGLKAKTSGRFPALGHMPSQEPIGPSEGFVPSDTLPPLPLPERVPASDRRRTATEDEPADADDGASHATGRRAVATTSRRQSGESGGGGWARPTGDRPGGGALTRRESRASDRQAALPDGQARSGRQPIPERHPSVRSGAAGESSLLPTEETGPGTASGGYPASSRRVGSAAGPAMPSRSPPGSHAAPMMPHEVPRTGVTGTAAATVGTATVAGAVGSARRTPESAAGDPEVRAVEPVPLPSQFLAAPAQAAASDPPAQPGRDAAEDDPVESINRAVRETAALADAKYRERIEARRRHSLDGEPEQAGAPGDEAGGTSGFTRRVTRLWKRLTGG